MEYSGRNLHFGVREHGMGAILNGLATHGGIDPFRSNIPDLFGLHAASHAAGGINGCAGDLCIYA